MEQSRWLDGRTPSGWRPSRSSRATRSSSRSGCVKADAHYDITNVELTICRSGWIGRVGPDSRRRGEFPRRAIRTAIAGESGGLAIRRHGREPPRWSGCPPSTACWRTGIAAVSEDRARRIGTATRRRPPHRYASKPSRPAGRSTFMDRRPERSSSPFWVKDRDDAPYLSRRSAGRAPASSPPSSRPLRTQVPSLSCAHGIREGGLRYGLYPGLQDARIYIRGSYANPAAASRGTSRSACRERPPAIESGSGRLELARWLRSARQPADGPGDGQPDLAAPFRRGDRPHAQQLRPCWASRRRIPSCSTGWPAVRGIGLVDQGHAPADHALGRLPAVEPGQPPELSRPTRRTASGAG